MGRAIIMWCEVAQSCPTLCDPMDCSLPGCSLHGILQARVLEWVAITFSRGSFPPKNRTQVSHIISRRFTIFQLRSQGQHLFTSCFVQQSKFLFTLKLHWVFCYLILRALKANTKFQNHSHHNPKPVKFKQFKYVWPKCLLLRVPGN